jgi:urea transporter
MFKRLPDNFATSCLRGSGQVFFQENAATGGCFLLAIFYASYAGGQWSTSIGALIGLGVATLTAYAIDRRDNAIGAGMYGFNGILVGVAVPTFLVAGPVMWFYVVVGAAVSTVVMDAMTNVVSKNWGVAASTGPFVLTTWMLMLAAYSFANVGIGGMGPSRIAHEIAVAAPGIEPGEAVAIVFRNVAQVFLLGSAVSGVLIVIGLMISSIPAAVAAICGSIIALAGALWFGADPASIKAGLYGFSPVLTAIAVAVVFIKSSAKVVLFALLATIFTVIAQGAMDALMSPFGIPTFTAPYVLVMWLFTLPKQALVPHPHSPDARSKLSAGS